MIDPRKYWTMCRVNDWLYVYSDDPEVYRYGKESNERLVSLTDGRPELADIYNAWRDHVFNCGPRPAEPKLEE